MSEATIFLDNLSNWYIRRNRRRFWKSENDSDKTAAYSTLYQILINFVKVMAPVVPFVSDKIYTNLISGRNKSDVDSVHLCDFPSVGEADIDEEIINEIDTVIQIVSLSRSARNKANIKIRQPLSELAVYADDNIQNITKNNQNEILEELNIKLDNNFKPLDGISLIPLINGKPFDEKIAYTETANPLNENAPPKKPNTKSVRTSKWKFILNEYDNSKELYNLENDPNELENIAGNGLEMEDLLLKELNKLQDAIL